MSTDSSILVKLKFPVVLNSGATLTEVKLRRPKAKDMRNVTEDVLSGNVRNPVAFLPLIASVTGVSEGDLEEMDVADIIDISAKLTDFLVSSLPTGKTS